MSASRSTPRPVLPAPSAPLVAWFKRYTRYYFRRHFHAVRLAGNTAWPASLTTGDAPLIIYINHPAWWDPLLCTLLVDACFAGRQHWAVIEQAQLRRYRFFARLGFVGVEPDSRRGACQLLALADALALGRGAPATLWLTPQGRFIDARERPLRLAPGLGHLARRLPEAWFLPLALEYAFWQERLPEALARFGQPFRPAEHAPRRPREYTVLFTERLTAAADALAAQSIARAGDDFQTLLAGRAGVGGCYDLWRKARARWRGERFSAAHGDPGQL